MQAQQHKHIQDLADAMRERPTLVISYYTAEYAEGSYSGQRFALGVRGSDDWLVEMDCVDPAVALALVHAYGPGEVHYLLNDDSVTQTDFWKVAAVESALPVQK